MIITMGIKSNLIKHLKETILANIKIIKFETLAFKSEILQQFEFLKNKELKF